MVTRRQARRRLWLLVGTVSVLTAAVAVGLSGNDADDTRSTPRWAPATGRVTDDELVVSTARSAAATTNVATRRLLAKAPVAVVVPAGDPEAAAEGTAVAEELRAPLLFAAPTDGATGGDPFDLTGTTAALSTDTLVLVGGPRTPEDLDTAITLSLIHI